MIIFKKKVSVVGSGDYSESRLFVGFEGQTWKGEVVEMRTVVN